LSRAETHNQSMTAGRTIALDSTFYSPAHPLSPEPVSKPWESATWHGPVLGN